MNIHDLQAEHIDALLTYALQEQSANTMLCAYLLKQNAELRNALRRIDELENPPGKEKSLPFLARFPDLSTIVALKAQLWEQPAPKQGVPRFKIKVAVWDRPEDRDKELRREQWPNGRYANWFFYLQCRDDYHRKTGAYEGIASHCWIGPLTRKKNKGTIQHQDHVALLNPETWQLCLDITDHCFDMGEGEPAKAIKTNAPIRVWALDL